MQVVAKRDFKALVDNYPRAIMLATLEPKIAYVNRMFRAVTGYQLDEVVGHAPSILSSGLHSQEFYQSMWNSLNQSGCWEGLIWNRRKNGEAYPQWLTIYPIEDDHQCLFAAVFMDVGDVTAGNERLASLAYYDPLTELPNRSLFQEFLRARVSQRPRRHACFAVLFIDLDFFKTVNDLHGHECGDRVLQQAASGIRGCLRGGDIVARLSGDEFAAIVELNARDELEGVCQRVIDIFRAPLVVDDQEYFLSVSVGAALHPFHGRTGPKLLQNADQAMYTAKMAGRGCYRVYCPLDNEQGHYKQRVSEALMASLKTAQNEFSVVFQPQYSLATGAIVGLEALLRWNHPALGEVPPADFVPVAEQRGIIHELTEQLVRCILEVLPTDARALPAGLTLAINISARQIADARLAGALAPLTSRIRQLSWLPEVEITETNLMHLSKACLAGLGELRDQGVIVAVDDFGTGYSSLAYLHTLPVQVLKIDRQFIKRLDGANRDSRIVSAILGMADALGLDVVAEGVETREQYCHLRELGCDRAQGYWMARPGAWATIEPLLFDKHQ